jgi:hypothetical protein
MTIYVYSPNPSNGARDLTAALGGTRLRTFDGMDFWRRNRRIAFQPEDLIICWGAPVPELDGVRMLNHGAKMTKFSELKKLQQSGLMTPQPERWASSGIARIPDGWVGRSNNHVGGADLLNPTGRADYLTSKLTLTREIRVHSFDGKSIRAGQKIPRDGFKETYSHDEWVQRNRAGEAVYHPWVRSFDGGWRINYDNFKSNRLMRETARLAISHLDLTFGAVDMGFDSGGNLYVLEVNRAPGADPPTLDAYTKAIRRWLDKAPQVESPAEVEAPVAPPAARPIILDRDAAIERVLFQNGAIIPEAPAVAPLPDAAAANRARERQDRVYRDYLRDQRARRERQAQAAAVAGNGQQPIRPVRPPIVP